MRTAGRTFRQTIRMPKPAPDAPAACECAPDGFVFFDYDTDEWEGTFRTYKIYDNEGRGFPVAAFVGDLCPGATIEISSIDWMDSSADPPVVRQHFGAVFITSQFNDAYFSDTGILLVHTKITCGGAEFFPQDLQLTIYDPYYY